MASAGELSHVPANATQPGVPRRNGLSDVGRHYQFFAVSVAEVSGRAYTLDAMGRLVAFAVGVFLMTACTAPATSTPAPDASSTSSATRPVAVASAAPTDEPRDPEARVSSGKSIGAMRSKSLSSIRPPRGPGARFPDALLASQP